MLMKAIQEKEIVNFFCSLVNEVRLFSFQKQSFSLSFSGQSRCIQLKDGSGPCCSLRAPRMLAPAFANFLVGIPILNSNISFSFSKQICDRNNSLKNEHKLQDKNKNQDQNANMDSDQEDD